MSMVMGHRATAESQDHVTATYREIAVRFGLGGPNAARTKVKHAGWAIEPAKHPAHPVRVRVPREAWSQTSDIPRQKNHTETGTSDRDGASQKESLKSLERERQRADQAEARADRAEQGRDAERARADAAVLAVDEMRALLAVAEAKIEAMDRAEAERAVRPLWRWLRDAWTRR